MTTLAKNDSSDGPKTFATSAGAAPRSDYGLTLAARCFLQRQQRRNITSIDDIPPMFRGLALTNCWAITR